MWRRGIHLLVVVVGALVLLPASRGHARSPQPSAADAVDTSPDRKAVIVTVEGRIDDATRRFVEKRFAEARALGADTVILKLNTPGGLAQSGLDMSRFLKQQDDLHVIAYVEEMALSAGIMIGLAADEIVMQPGAMIGDSAPIALSPGGSLQTLGDAERAKAESPILADFRDSAFKNGYDPLLAEAMVTVGRVVRWVENEKGERRFVNEAQFDKLVGEGWHEVDEPNVPKPVDAADTLLTVSAETAVKLGLAKGTAASAQSLAEQRGLRVAAVFAPSGGDKLIGWIGSAPVRFLLLVAFFVSLYAALHAPGHGMAEVAALVSLGLLVAVPLMTGYARWWEIAIVLVGLGLLAIELFLIPGFGFTGVIGIVMILGGLVMTFVGNTGLPGSWKSASTWSGVQTGLLVVTSGVLASLLIAVWLRRFLPKVPYMNRLILAPPAPAAAGAGAAALGGLGTTADDTWPFVGTIGRAVTDLKPGGTAQFPYADDTRVTSVVSDGGYVNAGAKVVVHRARGSHVVVRPVPSAG